MHCKFCRDLCHIVSVLPCCIDQSACLFTLYHMHVYCLIRPIPYCVVSDYQSVQLCCRNLVKLNSVCSWLHQKNQLWTCVTSIQFNICLLHSKNHINVTVIHEKKIVQKSQKKQSLTLLLITWKCFAKVTLVLLNIADHAVSFCLIMLYHSV